MSCQILIWVPVTAPLTSGSIESIAELIRRILDDGISAGGHIFSASITIMSSVRLENYLAMVNAYRDYFRLERIAMSLPAQSS